MRLWSLHPRYLDPKGLVAVWREGLLALEVLRGNTKGYRHHPQLDRFRNTGSPVGAIKCYLLAVYEEATARGYRFNPAKILRRASCPRIQVTTGQLRFEMEHLKRKLRVRQPARYETIKDIEAPEPHPLFAARPGGMEDWERVGEKSGTMPKATKHSVKRPGQKQPSQKGRIPAREASKPIRRHRSAQS